MRRRSIHGIASDMTPLIDVVFLLIVFFVLVSRIVDEDRPRLDLPTPVPAASRTAEPGPRAIVNIMGEQDLLLKLDGRQWQGDHAVLELQKALAVLLRKHPDIAVQIRAGRATPWSQVGPVLDAARRAGRLAGLSGPVHVQLAAMRDRSS
ncbi:MAG: biopolymer transporter ExbD [Phycisphaerales bacterium]|nr:biopolymer transporter ExbD [Phycisphaerales bacterium]